jgi:signal transduction histidine kinase
MIGEQIQTVIVLYPQTGRALVDSIQLEQVIMNLMLNTRDARELLPPG